MVEKMSLQMGVELAISQYMDENVLNVFDVYVQKG